MVVADIVLQSSGSVQPQERVADVRERTRGTLLNILRDNFSTQFVSQAPSMAGFHDAVSRHGTEDDDTLIADFQAHVPLSTYDPYKPFVERFDAQPCKEESVVNLMAPGLPDFIVLSSATSGSSPKTLPKYHHAKRLGIPVRPFFDPNSKVPLAALMCSGYPSVKVIEHAPGEVVQRVPVCCASGGSMRRTLGQYIDDESQMSSTMSGYAVPWAATLIGNYRSFLTIHALFFLVRNDVYLFYSTFAPQFVDFVRYIDEDWDMLLSCIAEGKIPDIEGIDHLRKYLEPHFHCNPERAAELREIGTPFSFEGWFARVWPRAAIWTICSGTFATVLPKMRSILGPNVTLHGSGYGSSEGTIGLPHDPKKMEEFVLSAEDFFEFLDVSQEVAHENLLPAWEVEVGKHYEVIMTTRDGLWRYQLGDVVDIVGFHPESKLPIIKYVGRKKMTFRFLSRQITDDQLFAAVKSCCSDDTIPVQEFTSALDERTIVPAIGFFIELAGPLGPNAHLVPQKLYDIFSLGEDAKAWLSLESGNVRLPTIRILKPGTFAEYRKWKCEVANIPSGQIKVPMVLLDPVLHAWIEERVVQEI